MISFPQAINSGNTLQNYDYIVVIAILLLFILRRVYRGIHGRKYRSWRIVFLPFIYILFTSFLFIIDFRLFPYYYLFASLFLGILGFAIGDRYGEKVSFFYQDGQLYYKRSPVILTIWALAYLFRLYLDFTYVNIMAVTYIIDAVLAMTTGMLVGEALNILSKKKIFEENNKP